MKFTLPDFEVRDAFGALSEVIGWGLQDHNIPSAWSSSKGKNVNVFVLDTGLASHPDLSGAVKVGVNCSREADEYDRNGHSTAICSVIAAQDNDQGLVGIAPECNIVCVKVMDNQGTGDVMALWKGLTFVLEESISGGQRCGYSPQIVIMSLGTQSPFPEFLYSLVKQIYARGIVIVCAAGNSGKSVEYPAAYPECISVGSYDTNRKVSSFSAKGAKVDFVAPGSEVYACWLNDGYKIVKGTSFAAPFLGAIIALILAKNQTANVQDLKNLLIKHSIDMGKAGKDDSYGYGAVDINKLLNDPNPNEALLIIPPTTPPKKKKWWQKILGL